MYSAVEWENKRFLINEVRLFKPEVSSHFRFQTWIIISSPYLVKILLGPRYLKHLFSPLFSVGLFSAKIHLFSYLQTKISFERI